METQEIIIKAKEFEDNPKFRKTINKALQQLKEFLKLYPYGEDPEAIDLLTPERVYDPGSDDYFFLWIEHKLRDIGRIRIGSALVWENAKKQIDMLKDLLRLSVDESRTLSEKIDAHWEDIKGFGGDKTLAKKIVSCYYHKDILPIFKTEDLEHFANVLEINFKKESYDLFGKSYDILSIGKKFELLNNLLIQFKNKLSIFENWDNSYFIRFLYETYPPFRLAPPEAGIKPLYSFGLLFEPSNEMEVMYLFSLLHREIGFQYIISLSSEFPDAKVMNEKKEVKTIEFELRASSFIEHKHDPKGCDFVVCWENDLEDERVKDLPEILSLKDIIEKFK